MYRYRSIVKNNPFLLFNFPKKNLNIIEEAIKRHGDPTLYIDKVAYSTPNVDGKINTLKDTYALKSTIEVDMNSDNNNLFLDIWDKVYKEFYSYIDPDTSGFKYNTDRELLWKIIGVDNFSYQHNCRCLAASRRNDCTCGCENKEKKFEELKDPNGDGRVYFRTLNISNMSNLIENNFVDPSFQWHTAPSIQNFINFINEYPEENLSLHGYILQPHNDDYRVFIKGIECANPSKEFISIFIEKYKNCRDLGGYDNFSKDFLICWYD